jgi:hypothetical protein
MISKNCSIIVAADQGQVYGSGSVGNDTTTAIHFALNCSSQLAGTLDYAPEHMLLVI